MKKIRIILILLVFKLGFSSFAIAQNVTMQYHQFRIYYEPKDEKRALKVVEILKTCIPELEIFFETEPQGIIKILLPATREEFANLTGGSIPDWSVAVYVPLLKSVVLKKAGWVNGNYNLENHLRHELAHVYFQEKFENKPLPLWFNEGLAEYLSGSNIGIPQGVILSNALLANKIMPLSHIDSLLMFDNSKAQLAYLQSQTVIRFLDNNYIHSADDWHSFLNSILKTDFQSTISIWSGADLIDFEILWYRWLQEKYRWFVVFNLENLIWVALVIVLAGALYAIRYRNRKKLRQWELEEASLSSDYYDVNFDYPDQYYKNFEEKE